MKHFYTIVIAMLCITQSAIAQHLNESNRDIQAVDLGLSVKWASHDIGASTPFERGESYVLGETFVWSVNMRSSNTKLTDHNEDYSGSIKFDVATQVLGNKWRIPTLDEWNELINNCSWEWHQFKDENNNEIAGYKIVGTNGNFIFLCVEAPSFMMYTSQFGYHCSTPVPNSKRHYAFAGYGSKHIGMVKLKHIAQYVHGLPVRAVSDY